MTDAHDWRHDIVVEALHLVGEDRRDRREEVRAALIEEGVFPPDE